MHEDEDFGIVGFWFFYFFAVMASQKQRNPDFSPGEF